MTGNRFDSALQEVGEFGLYQKRLLILVYITSITVILQNLSPVFTMKTPNHRCKIPGLDNDTYELQDANHAYLINRTIPVDENGDYATCSVYEVIDGYDITAFNGSEVPCNDWVFDKSVFKSTYVTELQLVCNRKQFRSHSTMMIFAGKFLGAFCNSAGGDYFGRRRVYLMMMLAMTATGIGLIFVSSLPALMVLRFFAGATTTGTYLPVYVITLEMLGTKFRRMVSVTSKVAVISAGLLGTLFFFLLRDWRYFQICLAAPCTAVIIGYWFTPESPRWLLSNGKMREAKKVIEQVAKTNGAAVPHELWTEELATTNSSDGKKPEVARTNPLQLFRVPRLALRYFLLYGSWILTIMCAYGLKLNVTNMSGDIFVNYTFMTIGEFVALLLFALLVERVGRRRFLIVAAGVGGLACVITILPTLLGASDWVLRGLSFAGKMCVSAAISAIYIFSPELFPTVLRSFGLGSCSMMSRIGGLASPYVADLNILVSGSWSAALPQVVFGVAGLMTACMAFFLPETRGRHLPETLHDAEMFGRSQEDNMELNVEQVVTATHVQEDKNQPLVNGNEKDSQSYAA